MKLESTFLELESYILSNMNKYLASSEIFRKS